MRALVSIVPAAEKHCTPHSTCLQKDFRKIASLYRQKKVTVCYWCEVHYHSEYTTIYSTLYTVCIDLEIYLLYIDIFRFVWWKYRKSCKYNTLFQVSSANSLHNNPNNNNNNNNNYNWPLHNPRLRTEKWTPHFPPPSAQQTHRATHQAQVKKTTTQQQQKISYIFFLYKIHRFQVEAASQTSGENQAGVP